MTAEGKLMLAALRTITFLDSVSFFTAHAIGEP